MKLEGRHDLPFPRDEVWEALMDPAVLSRTLPGCEALERTGEHTFAGRMRVAVGPVRGEFRGTLELAEVEPPEGYRMRLEGRGPSGFLSGEGTVRLEDAGGGATRVVYDLDAQVGGRIAGVGQRVLDSSARSVARQGLEGLERQLAARRGGGVEQGEEGGEKKAEKKAGEVREKKGGEVRAGVGTPVRKGDSSGAAPPSQARFAAEVARDVVADLVPPEQRGVLAAAGAFVAGLLLGILFGFALGRSG